VADFDVSVIALQTPPAAAPLTTYRPTLWVRNNGLHAAIASGTISAYKAGLLVYSSPVLSDPIAPGVTGLAAASADWLPAVQGDYIWTAYVTTNHDQYEPNNNLGPTKITVGPPPPPPVQKTLDDIYEKLGEVASEETLTDVAGKITPDPSTDTVQKKVLDTVATEATLEGIKTKTDNLATEATLSAIKDDTATLATETTLGDINTKITARLPAELSAHGGLKVESLDSSSNAIPSLLECLGVLPFGTTAIPLVFANKTRTICITAHPDNTGLVFVGQEFLDYAGAHAIAALQPGDALAIDYDDSTDAIYVCGSMPAQKIVAGCTVIPGA
jgi:hypothetical protein